MEKSGSQKRDYDDGPEGMSPEGIIETNWAEVTDNFDDMKLREDLLRGIYAYGFEKPSAIQQRAIVPCITGRDVIAQAQSGTGKTATFAISILQQLDMELHETQALILAPTRELAQQVNFGNLIVRAALNVTCLCNFICLQIQKVVIALGDYMNALCHACIGGTNVRDDMNKLSSGMHVVVGTPGRVLDMINRKALSTSTYSTPTFASCVTIFWDMSLYVFFL